MMERLESVQCAIEKKSMTHPINLLRIASFLNYFTFLNTPVEESDKKLINNPAKALSETDYAEFMEKLYDNVKLILLRDKIITEKRFSG